MSNLALSPIPERTIARVERWRSENGAISFSVVYPTRGGEREATFTVPARSVRKAGCWLPNTLWFVLERRGYALYFHPKEELMQEHHAKPRWWLRTLASGLLIVVLLALSAMSGKTNAASIRIIPTPLFVCMLACSVAFLWCLLNWIGAWARQSESGGTEARPKA